MQSTIISLFRKVADEITYIDYCEINTDDTEKADLIKYEYKYDSESISSIQGLSASSINKFLDNISNNYFYTISSGSKLEVLSITNTSVIDKLADEIRFRLSASVSGWYGL